VIDVSFISLRVVLPHVIALLGENAQLVALVKPQFEAGKGRVGKKGVVRDADVHVEVLEGAIQAANDAGLIVRGLTFSPIKGPAGNIEFWIWGSRNGGPTRDNPTSIVAEAHSTLEG
jgi:23S rRNA (cytidine1920-2'-O)/16S rRNA (cytidine1409-2'-O)-methyltransferase